MKGKGYLGPRHPTTPPASDFWCKTPGLGLTKLVALDEADLLGSGGSLKVLIFDMPNRYLICLTFKPAFTKHHVL